MLFRSAADFNGSPRSDGREPSATEPCDICLEGGTLRPYVRVSLCGLLDADVFRCDACGFRQVRPRLTERELVLLYPDEYFDPDSDIGFSDYAREQQRNEREGYFLARRLERMAPAGRVLDVGCALGFLLDATRRYSGWEMQGIDVSRFAAFFASHRYGLDVRVGTLEQASLPAASFDVVVQKDLLEHVLRPRDHLRETHRILRPGGHLFLVTPNGEANLRPLAQAAARIPLSNGETLPLLDQGHLSFFTRDNLIRLFSETGFDLVEMRCIAVRRGLRALGYHPFKRPRVKRAPGGRPRLSGEESSSQDAPPIPVDEGRMRLLMGKLGHEIERLRSPLRARRAYFVFRQVVRSLDTLPARLELGLDFRCVLRRSS